MTHLRLRASVLAAAVAMAWPACGGPWSLEGLLPNLDEKIATLDNLVLSEQISRYSQIDGRIHRVDSFDTLVNIADGVEQYSEVRRNNRRFSHVSQIDGVWSFGEIVTMLRTTRDALNAGIPQPGAIGRIGQDASGAEEPEFELRYRYVGSSRRWFVTVGSKTYWLDFDGSVRIASRTGDVRRIAWTSSPLPPETGIARITWTVDFQSVEIAGRICNVPRTGVYRITRSGSGNRADWNVTRFSAHGRYGSAVTVRFEP